MAAPIRVDPLGASSTAGARSRERSVGATAAVDRDEHRANVARLRNVLAIAWLLWIATIALDWGISRFVAPQPLSWFLLWRTVEATIITVVVGRLLLPPTPSPREVIFLDLAVFFPGAFCVAMMALHFRGIASPYGHAVSCILMARGVTLPDKWSRSVFRIGLPTLAFPLTFLVLSQFHPEVRAQFEDPAQVTEFALNVSLQVVSFLFAVVGGHTQWSLRREVIAARQVGRYKLKAKLGAGAMGEVWLAHHPALKRDVALKLLTAKEQSSGAVARFEREIRATAELAHPHTVRVFDCGVTEEGQWYYAMEPLVGRTLAALVADEGPLAPTRAATIVQHAAKALVEAHGRGIIHRDLKPANLFLVEVAGESDFVKVLDFGVAKLVGDATDERDPTLTRDGAVVGTPLYMAPEQGLGKAIDARSDLYALGCVLYFALTGKPPYEGANAAAIIVAHASVPVPRLPATVPPSLVAVVCRCLAKRPEERYENAEALVRALDDAADAQ